MPAGGYAQKGPAKIAEPLKRAAVTAACSRSRGQFLATSGFGASYPQMLKLIRPHAWTEAGPQPTRGANSGGGCLFFEETTPCKVAASGLGRTIALTAISEW
jgi:hypothetical protein